jgi:proteasome lid subunit RPN8/RPN11
MVAHSLEEDPDECCGILSGSSGTVQRLYRITNAAKSPYRYLMDPQEFLKADLDSEWNGCEFIAFYHSHTHSPAYPSQTDVRMALQSGWLEVYYVLVSLEDPAAPQIRAFHIDEDGEVEEEAPEIV